MRHLAAAVALFLTAALLGGCEAEPDRSNSDGGVPESWPAMLRLDRSSLDLGSWAVNETSSPVLLEISNLGSTVTGVPDLSINGAGFVLHGTTCGLVGVPPGGRCTATVGFRPSAPGQASGMFAVSARPGGMIFTTLTGLGLRPGSLMVDATRLEIADTLVGSTSETALVRVRNAGDGEVRNFQGTLAKPEHFSLVSSCGTVLLGQRSCDFHVQFTPRSRGPHWTALIVTGGSETLSVPLDAIGLDPAKLVLQPVEKSFPVAVGSSSEPTRFAVSNTGDVTTGLPAVSFTGQHEDFAIERNACITPLAPLASCTVDVVFKPRAGGTKIAGFLVTASPGGTVSAVLSGTGL
jgi:hypothetical protein